MPWECRPRPLNPLILEDSFRRWLRLLDQRSSPLEEAEEKERETCPHCQNSTRAEIFRRTQNWNTGRRVLFNAHQHIHVLFIYWYTEKLDSLQLTRSNLAICVESSRTKRMYLVIRDNEKVNQGASLVIIVSHACNYSPVCSLLIDIELMLFQRPHRLQVGGAVPVVAVSGLALMHHPLQVSSSVEVHVYIIYTHV